MEKNTGNPYERHNLLRPRKVALPARIRRVVKLPVPKSYVNSALAYLQHATRCKHSKKKKPDRRHCWSGQGDKSVEEYIHLTNYNPTFIARSIRNALLSHDWETALDLILILLERGRKKITKFFVKASLPIVFHHPNSNPDFLYSFFETVTSYVEDRALEQFILLLFRLKEDIQDGPSRNRCKNFKLIDEILVEPAEIALTEAEDEGIEEL